MERTTVSELLRQLEENQPSRPQPFSLLFKVFQQEFLNESVSRGLLTPSELALSGDGTPVVTFSQQRKKRLCQYKERGISSCDCNRFYSQPDCDIGWDSSRAVFTTVMTSICSLPPTRKTICRYFRCSSRLPAMTPTDFFTASSP